MSNMKKNKSGISRGRIVLQLVQCDTFHVAQYCTLFDDFDLVLDFRLQPHIIEKIDCGHPSLDSQVFSMNYPESVEERKTDSHWMV